LQLARRILADVLVGRAEQADQRAGIAAQNPVEPGLGPHRRRRGRDDRDVARRPAGGEQGEGRERDDAGGTKHLHGARHSIISALAQAPGGGRLAGAITFDRETP
jgi:hypothetical protein